MSKLPAAVTPLPVPTAEVSGPTLPLQHGRHLALVHSGGDDLVEVRGAGGLVELRIRMTADGPVLQMESLKLSLRAAQDVDVQCSNFTVHAREQLSLQSAADVRINAPLIHLN